MPLGRPKRSGLSRTGQIDTRLLRMAIDFERRSFGNDVSAIRSIQSFADHTVR